MKLINDNRDDLSNEMMVCLCIALDSINAAEIIINQCAKEFDKMRAKNIFFQEKRMAIGEAAKAGRRMISVLEYGFDGIFDKIWNKDKSQVKERVQATQWRANDLINLLLIYESRADGNKEKKQAMKDALMKFSPDEEFTFELDALQKFFSIKD